MNVCQANGYADYQLGFFCIFTALVLAELILASLVDHFPKSEALERDEVSRLGPVSPTQVKSPVN